MPPYGAHLASGYGVPRRALARGAASDNEEVWRFGRCWAEVAPNSGALQLFGHRGEGDAALFARGQVFERQLAPRKLVGTTGVTGWWN